MERWVGGGEGKEEKHALANFTARYSPVLQYYCVYYDTSTVQVHTVCSAST